MTPKVPLKRNMKDPLPTPHPPIEPDPVEPASGGMFDDPLWFRVPVAFICGGAGFAVLYWTAEVLRSGVLWAIAVVVLGVEPLGLYLLLLAGAMVAPRSRMANWYRAARRRAWVLIAVWAGLVAVGVVAILVMGR